MAANSVIDGLKKRVDRLGATFRETLADPAKSNIMNRVAAAAEAESILEGWADFLRRRALHGAVIKPSSDEWRAPAAMLKVLEDELQRRFRVKQVPPVKNAAEGLKEASELRRVVAEARAHFCYIEPETLSVEETVYMIAYEAYQLTPKNKTDFVDAALVELAKDREAPGTGNLKAAAACVDAYLRISAPKMPEFGRRAVQKGARTYLAVQEGDVFALYFASLTDHYKGMKKMSSGASMDDVNALLDNADREITAEQTRCANVISADPKVLERAKRQLQKGMLESRSHMIVRDPTFGVVAQLQFPTLNSEGFRRLFNVLDFDESCVEKMLVALGQAVGAGVKTLSNPLSVPDIVSLRSEFTKVINCGVSSKHRLDFHMELQDQLSRFANKSNVELQAALHFDGVLKGKHRTSEGVMLLNAATEVLPLLGDSALFVQHYAALMSNRISKGHANLSQEAHAVNKIVEFLGQSIALSLTVMIRDAKRGQPLMASALAWPVPVVGTDSLAVPAAVGAAFDEFYAANAPQMTSSGFAMKPDVGLTTVEFSLQFPKCAHRCTVLGTATQATVMGALVAADAPMTVPALVTACYRDTSKDATQRLASEMALVLKTLVQAKFVIARGSGPTQEFVFNNTYMDSADGRKKVQLPSLGVAKMRDV